MRYKKKNRINRLSESEMRFMKFQVFRPLKMKTMNNWLYNNKEVNELPDGVEGFVYLITNLENNRKYVGKKLARFKTTKPPLKGKKNKRRGYKESDWRTYWGSSEHLLADVAELGEEKFKREILHYCPSRGALSYMEALEQFDRRVLETDEYYNGIINVRIGSSKVLKEYLESTRKKLQARKATIYRYLVNLQERILHYSLQYQGTC